MAVKQIISVLLIILCIEMHVLEIIAQKIAYKSFNDTGIADCTFTSLKRISG
jgi:hypothetical protein